MHQHPRPAPVTASPARSPRTNPTRTNNPRDQDSESNMQNAEVGTDVRGLGIEDGTEAFEQGQTNTAPAKEAVMKLNQIVQNYFTKAALIILNSRVDLPPVYSKDRNEKRVNKWFNVELDETDVLRNDVRTWKTSDSTERRPPPMIIETYLDADELTNNQSLVVIDDQGKRWDVLEALATTHASSSRSQRSDRKRIILERWRIELGEPSEKPPADLGAALPSVYKKSIVLFRSLFTYSKFLPAWKFNRRQGKLRTNPTLRIRYRITEARDAEPDPRTDNLLIPLHQGNGRVTETYSFGSTDSPAGPFSVQVTYRNNCEFRVDDSEALLSSRFMGADDEFFRPSLPSERQPAAAAHEVGSLPATRRDIDNPDPSQAYGSMSTFHQVGPTTGRSPISALRAAREIGSNSPEASPPNRQISSARPAVSARPSMRAESGFAGQRRPSISFQPFKAPPLSASPSLVDTPLGASPRTVPGRGTPAEARMMPPPALAASVTRRPMSIPQDSALVTSTSASPKPAPMSRYSSSFSHRRARPSSAGIKADDENSSGRASAASSAAQPGSGILAEPSGASTESIHADDENISDFLKMLDMKKDLLTPANSAALDATTRRTTAALSRFQRMRDSNAALTDSMCSSLLLRGSSTSSSRQLSSVPPMVTGTSISTASSPGKPISPHTPHTPAIPSRLSANSIIDYSHRDRPEGRRHRLSSQSHDSPVDESTSDETALDTTTSNANAIDIPTSPRPFVPAYRRSSSVAQGRRTAAVEDELGDFLPFGMRSVSLGAEERSPLSLSALLQQQELDSAPPSADRTPEQPPATANDRSGATECPPTNRGREYGSQRDDSAPENSVSLRSPYQPRFPHYRGRGSGGLPQSHGSASSSLGRGSLNPAHASNDRDLGSGSGSNSGISTNAEVKRGGGHRFSFSRPVGPNTFEDEEPLLFAMSDFGVSRRSMDEGGRGNNIGGDSGAPGTSSRRGSGRRGGGLSGFHAWQ